MTGVIRQVMVVPGLVYYRLNRVLETGDYCRKYRLTRASAPYKENLDSGQRKRIYIAIKNKQEV
jgi:hypothetical protein